MAKLSLKNYRSIVNIICVYISFIEIFSFKIKRGFKYLVYSFLVFSLFFNALMYRDWIPVAKRIYMHNTEHYSKWIHSQSPQDLWIDKNTKRANEILIEALNKKMFGEQNPKTNLKFLEQIK